MSVSGNLPDQSDTHDQTISFTTGSDRERLTASSNSPIDDVGLWELQESRI